MEILELSKSNRWVKFHQRFIENYANNTCVLKNDLIFIILSLLVAFPIMSCYLFITSKKIDVDKADFKWNFCSLLIVIGIQAATTFIGTAMAIGITGNESAISILYGYLGGGWAVLIGAAIIVGIIWIFYKIVVGIINIIPDRESTKPPYKKVVRELYKSAKEKYCKKIKYV